jgi:hypothetical protein
MKSHIATWAIISLMSAPGCALPSIETQATDRLTSHGLNSLTICRASKLAGTDGNPEISPLHDKQLRFSMKTVLRSGKQQAAVPPSQPRPSLSCKPFLRPPPPPPLPSTAARATTMAAEWLHGCAARAARATTVMAEWLLGKRRTPWVVAWCELALAGCAILAATVLLVTAMAATKAAAGGGQDARPWWSQWMVVKEWVLARVADNDREVCHVLENGPVYK